MPDDYFTSSRPPQKKGDNDTGFWIAAGFFLIIGAWPVSLIMLLVKFSDGKKKKPNTTPRSASRPAAGTSSSPRSAVKKVTKTPVYSAKGTKTLKTVGIVLAALGAVAFFAALLGDFSFYWDYPIYLIEDLSAPFGMMLGGLGMLFGANKMKRRAHRFGKYLACAGKQQALDIHQLAQAVGVSEPKAEKDLELMVEKGLWGESAYVDAGRDMLFLSPEAAQDYFAGQKKKAAAPTSRPEATGYEAILQNIRRANERIDDPVLSEKIDRIEDLSCKIIRAIQDQPEKKDKASTFFNYYLPTTQKLLDSYADFEEAGVSGKNLSEAKAKIEATMDNIVSGFARQLDELYQAEALDIDSDIRVMETLLRRDGASAEEDFGLGGTAVQAPDAEVE